MGAEEDRGFTGEASEDAGLMIKMAETWRGETITTLVTLDGGDEVQMSKLADDLHEWADSKRALSIDRQKDGTFLVQFIVERAEKDAG